MDLGLTGKVAIITGAGRGIGRAIALTLAEEGTRVVVNDYYQERAEAVARAIAERGGEALPLQADVTQMAGVEAMVSATVARFGRIDILVNNAGIAIGGLGGSDGGGNFFARSGPEEWQRTMDVITLGTLNCSRAVLPYMIGEGTGVIINIVSDAGRVGEPRLAAYSMAKAGVIGFMKALAKEEGRNGIRVNCVSPANTMTEAFLASRDVETAEGQARLQAALRAYPLGRKRNGFGKPEDIANAVAFLASPRAEWITGQVLSVNGGYSMVG